jgi:hypothetical protein
MTTERRFDELLSEFERIGVDPNSFPAGITVRPEEAIRILRSLPNNCGPAAFLTRLREEHQGRTTVATPPEGQDVIEASGGS